MSPYARYHQLSKSLLYHIFNRGHNKREIFHSPRDYLYFIKLLARYSKRFNFKVYHWVIMPNHYHFLLEADNPERLSSILAGIARAYTHFYQKLYNYVGYLWQGRFKSQPIEKESYLLACARYIERNPVKAGIVKSAWEYPFSSAQWYIEGKEDSLTSLDPLFHTFGKDMVIRIKSYKSYLDSLNDDDKFFNNLEFPLGPKSFLKRLVLVKGRYLPRRRGRAVE